MSAAPNFDRWLTRERRPGYGCHDFVAEVWAAEFGGDLRQALAAFVNRGAATLPLARRFTRLAGPISPCLAVFSAGPYRHHIGIWYGGRVLHLQAAAQYVTLDVAAFGYRKTKFYAYD